MHPSDKDPNNPTGAQYAMDFCTEHNLDPNLWGHVNNAILDGYNQGRDEITPLIKKLFNQAKIEREKEEHDKASALEIAAKAIRFIIVDQLEAKKALDKATAEQEEKDFALALENIHD